MSDQPRKPRRWLAAAVAAASAAKSPPAPFAREDRPRRTAAVPPRRAVASR